MAFQSAQASRASIGLLNASGYIRNWKFDDVTDQLETTTIADKVKQMIVGQNSQSASMEMLLDTTAPTNSQFVVMSNWKTTTPLPFDIAPEGYATGNPVVMMNALETQANTKAAANTTVDGSASAISSNGTDYGISVEDYTAITTTTTGTARDSGIVGGTANGGVAHLHISAYTGLTSNTVTIEHSVDGSTSWATLVTFTLAAGLTSERVVVAAGTTVRKFLRVVDTVVVGGGGSNTRQVSFARR